MVLLFNHINELPPLNRLIKSVPDLVTLLSRGSLIPEPSIANLHLIHYQAGGRLSREGLGVAGSHLDRLQFLDGGATGH
jgi:hypothetical protein